MIIYLVGQWKRKFLFGGIIIIDYYYCYYSLHSMNEMA